MKTRMIFNQGNGLENSQRKCSETSFFKKDPLVLLMNRAIAISYLMIDEGFYGVERSCKGEMFCQSGDLKVRL